MLEKMFEWYRLVNVSPDELTLERRRSTVNDLVKRITDAKEYDLLIDCTRATAHGLERGFDNDSQYVQSVVDSIRKFQAAFPRDLVENALELRTCSAITLGEILSNGIHQECPDEGTQLAANLFVTARGMQAPETNNYLRNILTELKQLSLDTLQKAALFQRQRPDIDYARLDKITPIGDETDLWTEVWPVLKQTLQNLELAASSDHEELEILWWLYGNYSNRLDSPIQEFDSATAALSCGVEVADRVILPPLRNITNMVVQATCKGRKKNELVSKSLEQIVGLWSIDTVTLLIPPDDATRHLVAGSPSLLPLTWLCLRLKESGGSDSWSKEFVAKTNIRPSQTYDPASIAIQAFNERTAQRLYQDQNSGA